MDWQKIQYPNFVRTFMRSNEKELHAFMGLAAEAGEVLDVYKKERIYGAPVTKDNYIDELGDVMFYLQAVCNNLGVSFEQIQEYNIEKLTKRYGTKPDFTPTEHWTRW